MDRGGLERMMGAQRIRMLMVDDSEDDAFLLYSELVKRGAKIDYNRVAKAPDMAAALATDDWDVIICDHKMPGFDSFGALEVLKQSGKDIPFIIYSGVITDAQAVSAMGEGVCDYIQKGNFPRLVPVIERELRGAAVRRAMRQADHRIKELAYYDSLSNLPNHNLFCARVNEWISEVEKRGKDPRAALYYLDIDRFMRMNSSFGYEVGNEILRSVGQRIGECAEPHAIVARLGGDAFGVFHPQVPSREAASAYGHLLLQAFNAPFMKGRLELYLTLSVGVALLPEDGNDAFELLMSAETAMATAKRSGGNQCRPFTRDENSSPVQRVTLESELRHAVERKEMYLEFQPIICSADRAIGGAEALLRWRSSSLGVVPEERFVPIAEEAGLIVEIGDWALTRACVQGREWHDRGIDQKMMISTKVSSQQFSQPRLLEVVERALSDSNFPADCLELEISESTLMQDPEAAIGMLRALRSIGVKICVDDFGTGYSSLSYLRRFSIDVLKIDKSLVRELGSNRESEAIIRAIIALAKSLDLKTVAEGVESSTQLEFLRREGCDRLQGFYLGKPVGAATLLATKGGSPAMPGR